MKVKSPLADMDIGIGSVRRSGNRLVLKSGADSSIDAEITVSAGEVLRTIGRVLATPSGLAFVVGLPWFWLRETFAPDSQTEKTAARSDGGGINKPW